MRYLMLLLVLASACVHAESVWLDDDWHPVDTAEQASFYMESMPEEVDGLWPVKVFYKDSEVARFEGALKGGPLPGKHQAVGPYIYRHANGQLLSTGRRNELGQFEGPTRSYDAQGVLQTENNYVASEAAGLQKSFHPNGQLERIHWVRNGMQEGVDAHYYEDGSLQATHSLSRGKAHGTQREYHPNGQLRERSHYVKGSRQGEILRYHPDGQLAYQATDTAQGLDGTAVSYYENGQTQREDQMRKGKRHGLYRYWYESGQLMEESHYRNGKQHGESRRYDEQGLLTSSKQYTSGRPVGEHRDYFANSEQVESISRFDDQHRLVLTQEFDRDGSKVEEARVRYIKGNELREREIYSAGGAMRRWSSDKARNWSLVEAFDEQGELIGRQESIDNRWQGLQINRGNLGWTGPEYETRSHYHKGKQQGAYESRLLTGELIEQGEYADDHKVGRWEYRDERVHRINHYNAQGQEHGEQRESTPDGELRMLAHYRNGKLHGAYEEYNSTGRLQAKGEYRDDRRHGAWQFQDPYEVRFMLWQGEYRQGDQVGDWEARSEAGYVTGRQQYDDQGRAQGRFYTFSDDGLLTEVERYRDGQRHGESISYVGGKPLLRARYENGERLPDESSEEGAASECTGSRMECLLFGG